MMLTLFAQGDRRPACVGLVRGVQQDDPLLLSGWKWPGRSGRNSKMSFAEKNMARLNP